MLSSRAGQFIFRSQYPTTKGGGPRGLEPPLVGDGSARLEFESFLGRQAPIAAMSNIYAWVEAETTTSSVEAE
jgi:hypothetical protein